MIEPEKLTEAQALIERLTVWIEVEKPIDFFMAMFTPKTQTSAA